jgi:hypothetical protein
MLEHEIDDLLKELQMDLTKLNRRVIRCIKQLRQERDEESGRAQLYLRRQ